MGKIKGWNRIYEYVWEHSNNNSFAQITEPFYGGRDGFYEDKKYLLTYGNRQIPSSVKRKWFKTSKESLKFVVAWMRKHPKG